MPRRQPRPDHSRGVRQFYDARMRLNPRWLGLAASTLLAASGFLAGKPLHHDAAWVTGVCVWFVALTGLGYAWWQLRDERAGLLVTAVLWSLPLLIAPP